MNTNREILEKMISIADSLGVTECDAILSEGESISMSAQNNELDTYKISGSKVVGIRVIKDQQEGLSYTEAFDEKSLEGGELGGNKDYGDIFGDTNLFKDFGGFDTKED